VSHVKDVTIEFTSGKVLEERERVGHIYSGEGREKSFKVSIVCLYMV
jgi:hypothetical protein